jgi:UDP-2,4-diacetamido-2,4,6-trideoxy-beta-L-altropyranose hydrolase
MPLDSIVFRCDASVATGTGHVMRCIALAQAVQDAGAGAVFAMAESTAGVRARLAAESCELVSVACVAGSGDDSRETVALARERAIGWIVVDGYQFGADFQRALETAGCKVLFIDDYGHASHYWADLVLNQNTFAQENLYGAREPYTRLLLGNEFCLLRREFVSWRGWKRETPPVAKKLLVTMGGSDPENFTATAINALRHLDKDVEATVVVGGSNPHFESLQRLTLQCGSRFRLVNSVSNMPELMAQADLAISAAGSTCWEMCFLQLPMVLIDLADNQKAIARALEASGAAIYLGSYRGNARAVTEGEITARVTSILESKTERSALSERCGKLVDGRGAERVFSELELGESKLGEAKLGEPGLDEPGLGQQKRR